MASRLHHYLCSGSVFLVGQWGNKNCKGFIDGLMEDGTSGVCECLLSYFCILLMEQENPFCYGDVCRCHFLNKRPAKRIFRLNCLEMCYDVITSGWRCVQNPELCFQLSYMIVSFILV